jgi:hypothetical protein
MIDGDNLMDDTYRWELIDLLKSARLADWLITQPDINQRLFIDAAKLLEEDAEARGRDGMTWIAACSGQRGAHQETIMTDEERQKLCEDLRRVLIFKTLCAEAADEIERLATELEKYKKLYSETEEAGWEGMPE